ncbi:MAG: bacillithiol biosynthesis deacetylase BshB1 [Bacteroidia bacterium]
MHPKIDILAFAAHPDDVEISISGTLLKHQAKGLKTGIVDLTRGELGTRGSADIRTEESKKATEILKLSVRENLGLKDGFFENNEESLLAVVRSIRKYRPEIILINAEKDRHPDHGNGHQLVKRAAFLSGLIKIHTEVDGKVQEAWRPKNVYAYIQDYYIHPDIVIDVSEFWEQRMASLMAYSSQFYDPNSTEPNTPISSEGFLNHLIGRSTQFGRQISVKHAEGLNVVKPIGIDNLLDLE